MYVPHASEEEGIEMPSLTLCASRYALERRSVLPLAMLDALGNENVAFGAPNPKLLLFTSSLADFGVPGVCGLTAADSLLESAVSTFWKSVFLHDSNCYSWFDFDDPSCDKLVV